MRFSIDSAINSQSTTLFLFFIMSDTTLSSWPGIALGQIQDSTKWGLDKHPPRVVASRGAWGHAPPENF